MLLRLNAATHKGNLYHFCKDWNALVSILRKGLRGTTQDLTWETSKQIGKTEGNLARFASLTRNPSAIIQFKNPEWRLAVILDGNELSEKEVLRPFFSHVDPGNVAITIRQNEDGTFTISTENTHSDYTVSEEEGDEILDFVFDDKWEYYLSYDGDLTDENGMTVTFNLGTEANNDPDITLSPRESYGPTEGPGSDIAEEDYQDDYETEGKRRPMTMKDFPGILYKIMMQTGYESEERLYKKKGDYSEDDKYFNIKNATMGVLIPDVYYFSQNADKFRNMYPDMPIYIYRDFEFNPKGSPRYEKFQELLRLNPEVKQLYRVPQS